MPYEQVRELLTDVRPGPVTSDNAFCLHREDGPRLVLRGGPAEFTAGIGTDPHGLHVEVDRDRGLFAVEGTWWFRSECRAEPHPKGTRVVQTTLNIAPNMRWMVPLVRLTIAGKHEAAMEDLLRRLGRALDCRVHLE